ncbi:MAG: glutamyl-tRNA amidotransferase [Clostridiaceae bacterium]|nr:glutamyl-tRNA amidotransferase [Clostridiaceae bacterium]
MYLLQHFFILATDGATEGITNLYNLLAGLITVVGAIVVLYGIVQVGMSISSQDHTQRTNGLFFLAGGLLIAFAPAILKIIGVTI